MTESVAPKPKHAGGRPTKYRPEYCQQLIEQSAKGWSLAENAHSLNVNRSTIDLWAKDHQEFHEALTRAKIAEQTWWERKGRESLGEKTFQPLVWKVSMQARFRDDYTERKEISGGLTIVLPDDVKAGL